MKAIAVILCIAWAVLVSYGAMLAKPRNRRRGTLGKLLVINRSIQ